GGGTQLEHRRGAGGIHIRNLYTGYDFPETIGIGSKVLGDLKAPTKIHDGHQAVGSSVGIDELEGGLTGLHLVADVHGGVVEEQNDVAVAKGGRPGGVGTKREGLHRLLLVVFPDLKILASQIADVVAFLVGDDGIDQYQTGLGADDGIGLSRLLRIQARQAVRRKGNGQGRDSHAMEGMSQASSSIIHRDPDYQLISMPQIHSGDLHGTVLGGQQLTLSIPQDNANHIASRLYIKAVPDGNAGPELSLKCDVAQTHFEALLTGLNEVPVAIKQADHHRQVVRVAVIYLLERQMADINTG